MQSSLDAYHNAGLLKFLMPDLNADLINLMFDNFNNVFGTEKKVSLEFRSKGDLPVLTITADQTLLALSAQIAVMNPLNPEIDAI